MLSDSCPASAKIFISTSSGAWYNFDGGAGLSNDKNLITIATNSLSRIEIVSRAIRIADNTCKSAITQLFIILLNQLKDI